MERENANIMDDAADMKRMNRLAALEYMLRHPAFSRSDVIAATGLSAPTIMKICDFFEELGLIRTGDKINTSAFGRKAFAYQLCSDTNMAVGLLLDGEKCRAGLVDMNGRLVCVQQTDGLAGRAALERARLQESVHDLIARAQTQGARVLSIGVALPAIVHGYTVIAAPYLDIAAPESLAETAQWLAETYGAHVGLENDVNAAAQGEYMLRGGIQNMGYIALNTGMGAGLILDGALYRGSHFTAGEIGYVSQDIFEEGGIAERGALERRLDRERMLRRWPALLQGDEASRREATAYLADHLALCIRNLQYILDLELFVLGGERIAFYGKALVDAVNRRLSLMGFGEKLCEMESASDLSIIGAGRLSMREYLRRECMK